ncbi:hypothetical protein CP533_6260 [Ophiocordyceps camponoti-saundersi (nom. inval.)]|nr:hypothetical protein CP533_6260 [Ophiocordyceps camponoti-saundersi (nom. inval.)]
MPPSSYAHVNTRPSRVQVDSADSQPTGQALDAEKGYTSESPLAASLSFLDSSSMARPSLDPQSPFCDDSTLQRSSSSSAIPTLPSSNYSLPEPSLSTRWAGFTAASQPGPSLFFGYESASALHTGPVSLTAPPSVSAGLHSYTSFPPASIASASEVSSTLLGASASVLSTATLPAQSSRARSPHEAESISRPLPRLSRSVSDDALLSSHFVHSTSHSLRQQLSFLVDAWMADRENCLLEKQTVEHEARRLQLAVEGDRQRWASDRSAMERQLKALRARVHRLELENASLKTATMRHPRSDDLRSPRIGLNGNSSQSEPDDAAIAATASLSSNPSQQSNGSRAYIFSPPLEASGAPRRPHFATSDSSRTSPPGAPASSHTAHRQGPHQQQPRHATADFMFPSGADIKGAVPIIDVQELDPKLEGIPIKANAVQKWTFSIAPNPRQPASKYRAGQVLGPGQCRTRRQQNRRSLDRGRISRDRQTSRDQTLQVLAVEESRRLTMHAGHTPNHSLSLLPTMTAAGGDSDGGRSTHGTDARQDADACAGDQDATLESGPVPARDVQEPPKEDQDGDDEDEDDGDEGFLDPCDDAPLKGPLMIKNIPAQDDLFFAQLDQRLEFVISGGQDALPSVLRAPSPAGQPMGSHPPAPSGPPRLAWDGAPDAEDEVKDGHEGEDVEPDVPLRLRSTVNFGAPFGST